MTAAGSGFPAPEGAGRSEAGRSTSRSKRATVATSWSRSTRAPVRRASPAPTAPPSPPCAPRTSSTRSTGTRAVEGELTFHVAALHPPIGVDDIDLTSTADGSCTSPPRLRDLRPVMRALVLLTTVAERTIRGDRAHHRTWSSPHWPARRRRRLAATQARHRAPPPPRTRSPVTADPLANDLDLVEQAREGSQDAIVELWVRHYPAALSAARRTSRQPRDAEELASDAFSNMLGAFASGGGPPARCAPTCSPPCATSRSPASRRASSSEVLSDDVAMFEDGTRTRSDPMSRQTEISMMRQAFAALPRRWQIILWRTAVDHDRNIEIGHDLGITPNAVAALAKRARRGLRQAYLQTHLSMNGLDAGCEPFVRRLPMLAVDGSIPSDELAAPSGDLPHLPGSARRAASGWSSSSEPCCCRPSCSPPRHFLTPASPGRRVPAGGGAVAAAAGGGRRAAASGAGAAACGGAGVRRGSAGGVRRRGRGRLAGRSLDLRRQADRREDRRHGSGCRGGRVGGDAGPARGTAAPAPSAQVTPTSTPPTPPATPSRPRHGDHAPPRRSRRRGPRARPPAPRSVRPARRRRPTHRLRPPPHHDDPVDHRRATPLRVGMRITGTPARRRSTWTPSPGARPEACGSPYGAGRGHTPERVG